MAFLWELIWKGINWKVTRYGWCLSDELFCGQNSKGYYLRIQFVLPELTEALQSRNLYSILVKKLREGLTRCRYLYYHEYTQLMLSTGEEWDPWPSEPTSLASSPRSWWQGLPPSAWILSGCATTFNGKELKLPIRNLTAVLRPSLSKNAELWMLGSCRKNVTETTNPLATVALRCRWTQMQCLLQRRWSSAAIPHLTSETQLTCCWPCLGGVGLEGLRPCRYSAHPVCPALRQRLPAAHGQTHPQETTFDPDDRLGTQTSPACKEIYSWLSNPTNWACSKTCMNKCWEFLWEGSDRLLVEVACFSKSLWPPWQPVCYKGGMRRGLHWRPHRRGGQQLVWGVFYEVEIGRILGLLSYAI